MDEPARDPPSPRPRTGTPPVGGLAHQDQDAAPRAIPVPVRCAGPGPHSGPPHLARTKFATESRFTTGPELTTGSTFTTGPELTIEFKVTRGPELTTGLVASTVLSARWRD